MERTKKLSIDNIYFHLKNIGKTITLQIKAALQNPLLLFIVIGFPILFVLGIGSLIRQTSLFVSAFSVPLILSIGVYYGYMKYSINDSTLGKNIHLTNITESEIVISTFVTVFIFTITQYYAEFLTMVIFESNGLVFSPTWVGPLAGSAIAIDIVWASINYWMVFLFYFQTYLLNVTLFFAISQFTRDYRTFSIMTLIVVLLSFIFGGVLSSTWDYYDPNSSKYLLSGKQLEGVYENGDWSRVNYNAKTFTYDGWYSYTNLFVPQYFNNQHFFNILTIGGNNLDPDFDSYTAANTILPAKYNLMFFNPYDSWWNFTLLAPYIYTMGYLIVGIFVSKSRSIMHKIK